jgi:hypothetical protein
VLPPEEIEELRGEVLDFYPDTASVMRKSSTPDDWGGTGSTYTEVLVSPVRVAALSTREVARLATEGTIADMTLVFPAETDIRQTDRAVVNGRTFEVVNVGGGGAWEIQRPVAVQEVA